MASEGKNITIIVISNRPKNFADFIEQFREMLRDPPPIVAVVDDRLKFNSVSTYGRVKFVETKSKNFGYMTNLGRFFSETKYILTTFDDEKLDSDLKDLISNFSYNGESFRVKIVTFFGDKQLKMWTKMAPRIFSKDVAFVRRVHETPLLKNKPIDLSKGTITNYSYKGWNEYWAKAISTSKRESKSFRRFIDLAIAPLYWFFAYGKGRDGLLGLELLVSSLLYALLSWVNGIKGHRYLPLNQLENLFAEKKDELSAEEKEYISFCINRLKYSETEAVLPIDEELEQLSSAFI